MRCFHPYLTIIPPSFFILDGGAEETVSDISPTEIHPNDSERDDEDPARACGEYPLDGFVFGSDGSEPGDGEPDEKRERGAGDEESRRVLD